LDILSVKKDAKLSASEMRTKVFIGTVGYIN